jgi:hypothetical protein
MSDNLSNENAIETQVENVVDAIITIRRNRFYTILSLYVIYGSIFFYGILVGSLVAAPWEGFVWIGVFFLTPCCLGFAWFQYRSAFRYKILSCNGVYIFSGGLAFLLFFGLLINIAEAAYEGYAFSFAPTVLCIIAILLLHGVLAIANISLTIQWQNSLLTKIPGLWNPKNNFKKSFPRTKKLSWIIAVVVFILPIMIIPPISPKEFDFHADASDSPIKLTDDATDVAYHQYGRGFVDVEFNVENEESARAWTSEYVKECADRKRNPYENIDKNIDGIVDFTNEFRWVNRLYRKEDSEPDPYTSEQISKWFSIPLQNVEAISEVDRNKIVGWPERIVVLNGFSWGWGFEDQGIYITYDRDNKRVYYRSHWH